MNVSIDSEKLLPLIKAFYELSGMKLAIYDNDFCEVLTYPKESSDFCKEIWKNCGKELCDKCTAQMCKKCGESNNPVVYTCHAGLTEAVFPLKENDIIFGYAVCGQVTNCRDENQLRKDVDQRCKDLGIDTGALMDKLSEIKYYSQNKIDAILQIVNALVSYIMLQRMVFVAEKPIGIVICDYIHNNLNKDLSIEALSKRFAMSKSKLYTVLAEYMPGGICSYIRKCRIDVAKNDMERNPQKPLWRIAQDAGFNNYEYFLRIFKTETGRSARKMMKGKV